MGNVVSNAASSKDDATHEESLPLLSHQKGSPRTDPIVSSNNNNNKIKMNRRFSTRNSTSKHHHHRSNSLQDIDVGLISGIWKWEGTVLSRIWPTVLVFMIYAAGVVFLPTAWVMDTPDTTSITILGIILGTLLGIRTNAAYERYMEGCKAWTNLINHNRNFIRILIFGRITKQSKASSVLVNAQRKAASLLFTFAVAANRHLQYESSDQTETVNVASPPRPANHQQLPAHASTQSPPTPKGGPIPYDALPILESASSIREPDNLPLASLSALHVHLADMLRNDLLDPAQFTSLAAVISSFGEQLITMERIVTTPMPMPYLVHLRQVIVLFCIILPLQVATKLQYWTIPIVGFTVFTYEGIDTIGKEIEDPFGMDHNDLPLNGYCFQIQEEIERFLPPLEPEECRVDGDDHYSHGIHNADSLKGEEDQVDGSSILNNNSRMEQERRGLLSRQSSSSLSLGGI